MKKKVLWQTFLALGQTLSGLILICFMKVHFLGNFLMTFGGAKWFDAYTAHLDKTKLFLGIPYIKLFVYFIACVALAHGLNGLKIIFRYLWKPVKTTVYVFDTKYRNSYLWYIHFITGALIFLLLAAHLSYACLFAHSPVTTAAMVKEHLQNSYYFTSIVILLGCILFHMCYGLRTILVKYNLLTKYQKTINWILAVSGFTGLILGIINLFNFIK